MRENSLRLPQTLVCFSYDKYELIFNVTFFLILTSVWSNLQFLELQVKILCLYVMNIAVV